MIRLLCPVLLSFAFITFPALTSAQQSQTANQENTAKKYVRPKNQTFLPALEEKVKDVTSEQLDKIKGHLKTANETQKRIQKEAGITSAMAKKRAEAYHTLPKKLKGKALREAADQAAGFNSEQSKANIKIGEAYRKFRIASMNLLKPSQRAKMPKWIRDDYRNYQDEVKKILRNKANNRKQKDKSGRRFTP